MTSLLINPFTQSNLFFYNHPYYLLIYYTICSFILFIIYFVSLTLPEGNLHKDGNLSASLTDASPGRKRGQASSRPSINMCRNEMRFQIDLAPLFKPCCGATLHKIEQDWHIRLSDGLPHTHTQNPFRHVCTSDLIYPHCHPFFSILLFPIHLNSHFLGILFLFSTFSLPFNLFIRILRRNFQTHGKARFLVRGPGQLRRPLSDFFDYIGPRKLYANSCK